MIQTNEVYGAQPTGSTITKEVQCRYYNHNSACTKHKKKCFSCSRTFIFWAIFYIVSLV